MQRINARDSVAVIDNAAVQSQVHHQNTADCLLTHLLESV